MILNTKYTFLTKEKGPKVILNAVQLYGVKEIAGNLHNHQILDWAKEINVSRLYTKDEIPWCGLFVGVCVKRAGYPLVDNPLWARSWASFGKKQEVAMLGDILVFKRGVGGHVGFYVAEDNLCYHVLGGNQNNEVTVMRIEKDRCISINRCDWKIGQPDNVRQIKVKYNNGVISKDES
jgi:uncharacterized protein (TIGR02594 family)